MKILVTGSSGLVGTALASALASAGHTVCRLVRPQSAASEGAKEGFAVVWNPATGELGGAGVGADAVVNLAGASIADGRWTARRKALLRSSRIDTTRALIGALAKMNARPSVLVSASAIGIYGDRGDETLAEESKPGTGFLAGLTQEWEAEALKAEALGSRERPDQYSVAPAAAKRGIHTSAGESDAPARALPCARVCAAARAWRNGGCA